MRSDLVTRETSETASASSPDGPAARPSPAGGWPTRGSSPPHWAKPANAADWRPCSPGGRPAGCSTAGGNGCADRARIAGRTGGTYVVGFGSWAAPRDNAHVGVQSLRPQSSVAEENPVEENQCAPGGEENPVEEYQEEEDPPKKTTSSRRRDHCTFRTAMTSTSGHQSGFSNLDSMR